MSILQRLSKEEIREHFTHEGWFYLCPIYAGNTHTSRPLLHEKNWVPSWWLMFNTMVVQSINYVVMQLGHEGYDFAINIRPLEDL